MEPYILVEQIFLDDLKLRGVEVIRSSPFTRYTLGGLGKSVVEVECNDLKSGQLKTLKTQYLVGCDGTHSKVRKSMLGADMDGESSKSAWGVLDGMFPVIQ